MDSDTQIEAPKAKEENIPIEDSPCAPKSDVVELCATALFENSPYVQLCQEELESLGRFVPSTDHLSRNIVSVIVDKHDSRSVADGKFILLKSEYK